MADTPLDIRFLKGVGEKRAKLFARLGIRTVADLLGFFPRDYLDFSAPRPIGECVPGELCCIRGMVTAGVRAAAVRPGLTLYRLRVTDDTGGCDITYFNNKYIGDMLKNGQTYFFSGRMDGSLFRKEMAAPEFIPVGESAGLLPVYHATGGLSTRMIRAAVRQALGGELERDGRIPSDPLPEWLRTQYGLCHLRFAIETIHFPPDRPALETARRRLIFEELLALQLGMMRIRARGREASAPACTAFTDADAFLRTLPFEPTGAQRRAVAQVAADMARPVPMNRLVEGDVGSGKTAVAAAAVFLAARNGLQAALMAPTEILARQHYQTLTSLLGSRVRVGLLTGGLRGAEKRRTLRALAAGEIDLAVGTHALMQTGVDFARLGLVVTDEQHRFGVEQRARLGAKGSEGDRHPHALIMSATPIPRTLALIIYGDLDISVLDEMPRGRKPILTYCVDSGKRQRVYGFIRQHLDKGLQAYIVCPVIEGSDTGLAAAEEYAAGIARQDFAGYRVGLLHGRMKAAEKDRVMAQFAAGELQLLVSTTVVEVGVDVPNAVIMVVENAERFGLSQLHQLRGRVGRGSAQSYCILISDAQGGTTAKRLRILCDTSDGFEIAENDLKLRGPGDFFGKRQHGLPALKIADLLTDSDLLREAREAAGEVLTRDPTLSAPDNAGLRRIVNRLFADENIVFN